MKLIPRRRDPRLTGRHAVASKIPLPAIAGAALLAAAGLGLGAGHALAGQPAAAAERSQNVAASTAPPVVAARSLRAVRDLQEGDAILFYPDKYSQGQRCTFAKFDSPSPKFATANCGAGEVELKICDIASITAYARPDA